MLSLLLFGSCSIYRLAHHHVSGKLKRSGLVHRVLSADDLTLSYWDSEQADKPPLLLLHGFGASTEFQWYKQVQPLAKHYRLILPNLLFFGGSSSRTDSFRIADQVAAVRRLLDHLQINRFSLAGTSYGGIVAAELALQNPNQIERLALFDSPVKFFQEQDILPLYQSLGVSNPEQLLVPDDPAFLRILLQIAYHRPPKAPLFVLKDIHKGMYTEQTEEKRQLLRALSADSTLLQSRQYPFTFPILLVWGEQDRLIPPAVGEQLRQYFAPHATLHLIPNAAHAPNLERPRLFNDIIGSFFNP